MKHAFCLLLTITALICASCPGGDYPDFTYTNNSQRDISFKTGERDSPGYQMKADTSMSLDSAVRGRADIFAVQPPYVSWKYNNGNIYDIVFTVDPAVQKMTLNISNTTSDEVTIIEEGGYMYPAEIAIPAGNTPDVQAEIFTASPSFKVQGSNADCKYHIENDGMILVISR